MLIATYRLGGSCLLLPLALFIGSNALNLSLGKSTGENEDCDSSSAKSAESSGVVVASPEAYLRQHRVMAVADGLASLTVNRAKLDDSSRRAIVLVLKRLLSNKKSQRFYKAGIKKKRLRHQHLGFESLA